MNDMLSPTQNYKFYSKSIYKYYIYLIFLFILFKG